MGMNLEKNGKGFRLTLDGKVGTKMSDTLGNLLKEKTDAPMTIDLNEVESIDVSVVLLIVAAKVESNRRGQRLNIIAPSSIAERIVKAP